MRSDAKKRLRLFGKLEEEIRNASTEGDTKRVIRIREIIYNGSSALRKRLLTQYRVHEGDLDNQLRIQGEIDSCSEWIEEYSASENYQKLLRDSVKPTLPSPNYDSPLNP